MTNKKQPRLWQALLALLTFALFPVQIMAQTNVTTNDSVAEPASVSNDSLLTLVHELQERQASTEQQLKWDKVWKNRRKHWSFSYITSQKLTLKDNEKAEIKSKFGVNIKRGRTWYLPNKPIGGMVKFGIDLDLFDLTYVQYESETKVPQTSASTADDDDSSDTDLGRHHVTYGIGLGASVTVNPVDHLKAAAFFHYIPGVSALIYDSEVSWGYQGMYACGFNLAWKAISLGFETRWGSANFSKIDVDDVNTDISEDDVDYDIDNGNVSVNYDPFDALTKEKQKLKIKSFLVTLAFRF